MLHRAHYAVAVLQLALALVLTCTVGVTALRADPPVTVASNRPSIPIAKFKPPASPIYMGFSFTTGASGPYDDLVLNLFSDTNTTVPNAPGTGYLLSTAFTGLPGALSSSATGFLGSAVGSGGYYTFDPTVTLQADTTYYFYQNGAGYSPPYIYTSPGQFTTEANATTDFGTTVTNASKVYSSYQPTFLLTGSMVAVPEPATDAELAGVGALAVAWVATRRRRNALQAN